MTEPAPDDALRCADQILREPKLYGEAGVTVATEYKALLERTQLTADEQSCVRLVGSIVNGPARSSISDEYARHLLAIITRITSAAPEALTDAPCKRRQGAVSDSGQRRRADDLDAPEVLEIDPDFKDAAAFRPVEPAPEADYVGNTWGDTKQDETVKPAPARVTLTHKERSTVEALVERWGSGDLYTAPFEARILVNTIDRLTGRAK